MKYLKIKDIGEVVSGSTPKTEIKEYWDGDINWVTPKELGQLVGKYLNDTERKITEKGLESCSTRLIPRDNILFTSRAPIGHLAINKIEVCTNQGFKSIILKSGYSSEYIYYALKNSVEKLQDLGTGTTFKELSKGKFEEFAIPVPPLPDQLHIANILSKAENLIAQRKESIRLLDEFLKSTFLEMFGDPVRNDKGWDVKIFGEFVERITKGESPKWQGFDYLDSGVRFITSENVLWGSVDLQKAKFIHEDFHNKLKRSQLKENDLLVNLVGASVGRSSLCPKEALPANINQAVAAITLNPELINAVYVMHLFINQSFQRLLLGNVVEAARANLSLSDLRNLKFPVPPLELQTQFARIVEKTEALKSQYQQSLQELENLYGSLSQRAFRGELSINKAVSV